MKIARTATAAPDPAPLLPQRRQPLPSSSSSSSDDGEAGPRRGAAGAARSGRREEQPARRGAGGAWLGGVLRSEERAVLGEDFCIGCWRRHVPGA